MKTETYRAALWHRKQNRKHTNALTLINKKTIKPEHFVKKENGAVLMNDTGRKTMISAWQGRKRDKIKHPFLGDKIEWGLIPHVQALLLARLIRGDLDEYPVFLWK